MRLCGTEIGLDKKLFVIAGPCVIENEAMILSTAETLKGVAERLGLTLIFKSSFDKANRSSGASFRGPGMDEGLRILEKVRDQIGLPVLTDVHSEEQVRAVADVVDVLQTPAFLARQTDFINAVATSGKPVNIKKGQFMAPGDMKHVIAKARHAAADAGLPDDQFMVCERGASFGYNNLVSDMRSLAIMRDTECPVVFDATHSVQLPGGQGTTSGGQRGGRGRRRRAVHGNPSRSRQRDVGRPQCLAARPGRGTADRAAGGRCGRQETLAADNRRRRARRRDGEARRHEGWVR
jgi:2-dehydro-3-deoxyphosphooctonate aldolase (KDO 8-P synthase)